jgi:hypothetical protein
MAEREDQQTAKLAHACLSAAAEFLRCVATEAHTPWPLTDLATELLSVETAPVPSTRAVPVKRCFTEIVSSPESPALSLFLTTVQALEPAAHWQQNSSYEGKACRQNFLDNYGYFSLVGNQGFFSSSSLLLGFLLLGPNTHYPAHKHPAEELYVPLSGTALWQQEGRDPTPQRPGSFVFHASEEAHAIETQSEPLLACYIWRGDLDTPARLC